MLKIVDSGSEREEGLGPQVGLDELAGWRRGRCWRWRWRLNAGNTWNATPT